MNLEYYGTFTPIAKRKPRAGERVIFADAENGYSCEGYLTVGQVYARAASGAQLPFTPTHWTEIPTLKKEIA